MLLMISKGFKNGAGGVLRNIKDSVVCGRFAQVLGAVVIMFSASVHGALPAVTDMVEFGDEDSETAHALDAGLSEVVKGSLKQPARRLLKGKKEHWRGGRMTFKMAVDPDEPNYFTVKLWGEDKATKKAYESRLNLFINGKQVGHRHLGEVEMLDIMWYKGERYPGRFFYKTVPLPYHMTKGKESVELAIEVQGGISGYALTIEDYQKDVKEPSRPVYRVYTHTHPCFVPASDEVQGKEPKYKRRKGPGENILAKLKNRLNNNTKEYLEGSGNMHHEEIQFLATAYTIEWNVAYKSSKAIERIVEGLDGNYLEFKEKNTQVFDWWGKGPAADAVRLRVKELEPFLDENVAGTSITRRKAWAELFLASRNYNAANRRPFTNQSMFVDVNVYYCNEAIALLTPKKAWPEEKARRLLYESMGLEGWSGNWSDKAKPSWSQGKDKIIITEKGLTKELGYVGAYGEIVADIARLMYEATKPAPDQEGDIRLKNQLIKLVQARAPFRYPLADGEGYKTMNLESVVGWRDWHYPGGTFYGQANGVGGGSFDIALSTGDPTIIGYEQQLFNDNQYFAGIQERIQGKNEVVKWTRLLSVPDDYKRITKLPKQKNQLPMTEGEPDFVFADTDVGVIAVKNGEDILYASLYWRAPRSINNLARVHYLTPTMERDATVHIKTRFTSSGKSYEIPDRTNFGFSRGREEEFYKKQGMTQSMAGQKQPIAKVPSDDETYKPGQNSPFAGKGNFYEMEYGSYYVMMNCTERKNFQATIPKDFVGAKDLVSGDSYTFAKVKVAPGQTVVLYRK